ncbi:hypothetical protein ACIOWM_35135 [Streptomyces anulatus]
MSGEMKDGDEVRLIGSGGAPVLLTVGRPFSVRDIEARLNSREWRRESDASRPRKEKASKPADAPAGPQPQPEVEPRPGGKTPSSDPRRPAESAPKGDWAAYVAGLKHMTIEDASSYTKADLIEMAD